MLVSTDAEAARAGTDGYTDRQTHTTTTVTLAHARRGLMTAQLMPTMTVTGSVSLTGMRANSVLLITLPITAVVTIIIIALITLSIYSYSLQNEDSSYVSTLILIEVTTLHFMEMH